MKGKIQPVERGWWVLLISNFSYKQEFATFDCSSIISTFLCNVIFAQSLSITVLIILPLITSSKYFFNCHNCSIRFHIVCICFYLTFFLPSSLIFVETSSLLCGFLNEVLHELAVLWKYSPVSKNFHCFWSFGAHLLGRSDWLR